MIRLALLILLALTDPHFSARGDGPHSATIAWTQTARGCLSVIHATGEQAFIACYEVPGVYRITLGHTGPLDGTARPAPGDIYVLQTGGETYRTPLIWRQYLASVRR